MARFQDPLRWKDSLYELATWFIAGWMLTTLISYVMPGYPIVVSTQSIPMGIYWLDTVDQVHRGDYVTFRFKPTQPWLVARYGLLQSHTKLVLGTAGDTIYADKNLNLTLCQISSYGGVAPTCVKAGKVPPKDSKGRTLYSWLPANQQYQLKANEVWVYAPHPLSLDSRYQGPISAGSILGSAIPLWVGKQAYD